MENKFETLVERFKIIERKSGHIFKTKSMGLEWVPMGTQLYEVIDEEYLVAPPTSYQGRMQRVKKG